MKLFKQSLAILTFVYLFSSFRKKEVSWVAIGDSITYLNNHLNETGNRVTKGYLTNVVNGLPDWHYINHGYNGWTSGNIASRIDSLKLTKADVYSIFLGTNDWWQGRTLGSLNDYKINNGNSTVYGSFRIIINKIRSLNSEAKILLITPMQRGDFVYINNPKNNAFGSYNPKKGQYLEAFANAIDSIGEYENIPVVDLYHNRLLQVKNMVHFKRLKDSISGKYVNYKYPEFVGKSFHPDTDEYPYPKEAINLTYDGLHPSDKGNMIIAKAIIAKFKKFDLSTIQPTK